MTKVEHVAGAGRPLQPVEPKAKPGFDVAMSEAQALEAAGVQRTKPHKPSPQMFDPVPPPPPPPPPPPGGDEGDDLGGG